jgi:hypothetical protein
LAVPATGTVGVYVPTTVPDLEGGGNVLLADTSLASSKVAKVKPKAKYLLFMFILQKIFLLQI